MTYNQNRNAVAAAVLVGLLLVAVLWWVSGSPDFKSVSEKHPIPTVTSVERFGTRLTYENIYEGYTMSAEHTALGVMIINAELGIPEYIGLRMFNSDEGRFAYENLVVTWRYMPTTGEYSAAWSTRLPWE